MSTRHSVLASRQSTNLSSLKLIEPMLHLHAVYPIQVKAIGELGVRVGDEGDETEGTLITCKLVRFEWPEGFCKKQNIPRDTGPTNALTVLIFPPTELL